MRENITVYLNELNLSTGLNRLCRINKIITLRDLDNAFLNPEIQFWDESSDCVDEVANIHKCSMQIYEEFQKRHDKLQLLCQQNNFSIRSLQISPRLTLALEKKNINTIDQLLRMTAKEIEEYPAFSRSMKNSIRKIQQEYLGEVSINDVLHQDSIMSHYEAKIEEQSTIADEFEERNSTIENTEEYTTPIDKLNERKVIEEKLEETIAEVLEERSIVFEKPVQEVSTEDRETAEYIKNFDFHVIRELVQKYELRVSHMDKWFGVSRQRIIQILEKSDSKRNTIWTGKEFTKNEEEYLSYVLNNKQFEYTDDDVICWCSNNRTDNFVIVYIYETEIKCFFLKDLPASVEKQIIDNNFHRYSEQEMQECMVGDIISVMKVNQFIPKNKSVFQYNATKRGMSSEEYSVYLTGYVLGNPKTITDEQVMEYFDNNLKEGKVYVSSDPKNQWIRSLAHRSGLGFHGFIRFFGYEPYVNQNKENHAEELKSYIVKDNQVYVPTNTALYKKLAVSASTQNLTLDNYIQSLGYIKVLKNPNINSLYSEDDMQVYEKSKDLIQNTFRQNPLIGNGVLDEKTQKQLNENVISYLNALKKDSRIKLPPAAKMQITLAVINCAKNWSSKETAEFWKYITKSFGYRDDSQSIRQIIQDAVECSLKSNKRLFIEGKNGREFKATVLVHAMGPQKPWLAVCDMLFDFYRNNLNWHWVKDDPILDSMMFALKNKLEGNSDEDDNLRIAGSVYSFQEGVRKLILLRPNYCKNVFDRMLGKIDNLINGRSDDIRTIKKTYEEELCEIWYKDKIKSILESKETKRKYGSQNREIVIDYSDIKVKYGFANNCELKLTIPDIRLRNEDNESISLEIYRGNISLYDEPVEWYGNELGRTIMGKSVTIPNSSSSENSIDLQVKMRSGNNIIYDSETTLYETVLIFKGNKKISTELISRGNYTIIVSGTSLLKTENVEVTEIDEFKIQGLKAYFLELEENYLINVDGKILAVELDEDTELRIEEPKEVEKLPNIIIDDEKYEVAYYSSVFNIIANNSNLLQQYTVLVNDMHVSNKEFVQSENSEVCIYSCRFDGMSEDMINIKVLNLSNEKVIFNKKYMLVHTARCDFNRPFYYRNEDYVDAEYSIELDGFCENVEFTYTDDEIIIPYRTGKLCVNIPKINIHESSGHWFDETSAAWYIEDIPQESIFHISKPKEIELEFYVANDNIFYSGLDIVTIGNILHGIVVENKEFVDVEMRVSYGSYKEKIILAKVCYTEQFLCEPRFWFKDDKLYWNKGVRFIGKKHREFTLSLSNKSGEVYSFKITNDTIEILLPEDIIEGRYNYEITIERGSVFKKISEVIALGECNIGDENMLRFVDKRIKIRVITDGETDDCIEIEPCYIDRIEYKGVQVTTEGECPVYQGILHDFLRGRRYDFAKSRYVDVRRGIEKIAINPVKIIYISETTLSVTDQDKDGLYYYYYQKDNIKHYQLTDRQCNERNRNNYKSVELYQYEMESEKDV